MYVNIYNMITLLNHVCICIYTYMQICMYVCDVCVCWFGASDIHQNVSNLSGFFGDLYFYLLVIFLKWIHITDLEREKWGGKEGGRECGGAGGLGVWNSSLFATDSWVLVALPQQETTTHVSLPLCLSVFIILQSVCTHCNSCHHWVPTLRQALSKEPCNTLSVIFGKKSATDEQMEDA